MQRTLREDWLNNFLATLPGMIVSGHPSFSNMIGLTTGDKATIRFVANRNEVYAYILTIQSDLNEWERVKTTLTTSPDFQQLMTTLRQTFSLTIPVLLYDDVSPETFSVSDDLHDFYDTDGLGLFDYFARLNVGMTRDRGAINKQINRSVNDSFQVWTRGYLSRYIVVNDFDALLVAAPPIRHPTIFELKRIQESVSTWEPYTDDQANFAASLRICQTINARFLTIAYQVSRTDLVAIHAIRSASSNAIEGSMITCSPNDILQVPAASVRRAYQSTRRRQR